MWEGHPALQITAAQTYQEASLTGGANAVLTLIGLEVGGYIYITVEEISFLSVGQFITTSIAATVCGSVYLRSVSFGRIIPLLLPHRMKPVLSSSVPMCIVLLLWLHLWYGGARSSILTREYACLGADDSNMSYNQYAI